MKTRKVLADFPEGVLGVILTWPTIVEEGTSIEILLPNREGKLVGRPISSKDDPSIAEETIISMRDPQARFELRHLIEGRVIFATLHPDDSQDRLTLWSFSTWASLPAA